MARSSRTKTRSDVRAVASMAAEGVQSAVTRPRRTFTVLHLRSGTPPCAMRSRGAVSMSEMPTMNPRRSAGRWLACALLIACWTQAGVVVVHHHVPALLGEHSTGGNSGGQHDPATCVLCHFISQLRAQCWLAAVSSYPAAQRGGSGPIGTRRRSCRRSPLATATPLARHPALRSPDVTTAPFGHTSHTRVSARQRPVAPGFQETANG